MTHERYWISYTIGGPKGESRGIWTQVATGPEQAIDMMWDLFLETGALEEGSHRKAVIIGSDPFEWPE